LTAAFCALLSAARFDLSTPGRITRVADPQISPDGKSIAVVVSRANFADNRWDGELVLVDTATKAQTVATRGRRGVSQPRWSPDGSHLSYLATVEGRAQIFALPVKQPGEAMQLTKSPTGVQHYAWRPDGKAIAFVAADEEPKKEGEERHNRVFEVQRNDYLRQDAPKPWHIWIATLDGKNRRVTSGAWTVPIAYPPGAPPSPLTWSADNKSLAVVKVASPYSGEFNQAVIHILNTETGEMRPLTGRQANESQPVFSPDGSKVAYWYARDGQRRNVNEIQIAPVSGGEGTVLTRALDRNIQRAIWMPDGQSLLVSANDITTTAIWHQPLNGAARRLDLGPITVSGSFGLDASVSKSGAIAMTASEPLRPAELYFLSSTNARPERLTDFNSSIAALELGRSETIEWTGADGFKQDGVLTFPPDFQPSRKYPLVLYIHGGPTSASKQTFSARAQLFAAQGWIVFEPNYRGSDNRGNAFQSHQRTEEARLHRRIEDGRLRVVLRRLHDHLDDRQLSGPVESRRGRRCGHRHDGSV
jgi:dipeptidyl aminopeptidase/acylaminoacyl peptidase